MPFREDALNLIQQKNFEAFEALWMRQLDADPTDVGSFLTAAKALRKAEQRTQSDTLLGLLSDSLEERGLWGQRLQVLKEIGRLSRHAATLRPQLEQALRKALGGHRSFDRAFQFAKFNEPQSNPVERAEKIETWLQYDEGECFFMPGRGAGRVIELNPELGVCRLDFEKEKRVSVPLGAAAKFLTPLPEGHVLREKFTDGTKLRTEALSSPPAMLARILQSFGRAMQMGEVRDTMIGVVPEERWSSWWTAARKNPNVVINGAGAKATYAWSASESDAESAIRRDFDRGDVKVKLDLARKHSARNSELADYFSASLAAAARKVARTDPAMAWQVAATLEKLPGKYEAPIDGAALLSGPMASRVVASVDKSLREQALSTIRANHPDWPKVFAEVFFLEQEPRLLTYIMSAVEEAELKDIRDRLIDETLRYPRRHPHAFYWLVKRLSDEETLGPRANYNLLMQILDATTHDEFNPVRARLKDFFEKGALATRVVMTQDNEEQARKLLESIDRYGAIEEYRREDLKHALLMKYPKLREPVAEPIYATPDALQKKRAELEHLVKVEIPANIKAIQVARELGDLSENFEYKSARQRGEYLSAVVGKLQEELGRARPLDPAHIDAETIRVGTKSVLTNGDIRREVTILGPWESAPEHGVYSYQSEVAKALLGHAAGDLVSFMGNDYQVESIRRWNE